MLAFLYALALLGFPVSDAPAGLCRSDLAPRAYGPGDVVFVVLSCDATPMTARVSYAGGEVPLFRLEDSAAGRIESAEAGAAAVPGLLRDTPVRLGLLLGIDVSTPPGAPGLDWEVQFGGGDYETGMHRLTVTARSFPVQRLRLPRRYAEPDPETTTRIREESERLKRILAGARAERVWRGAFDSPLPDARGGGFGARRVLNGRTSSPHTGIDLGAPSGEAVYASNAGVVALVDTLYLGGKTVVLDHGLGLFTIYCHLSQTSVLEGDLLARGRMLGRVGATGRVTGPHLHW
ncbi:MAG: M23 family metallopeptidase, partial [Gemmatimonadetes bacterium]|nr:M23 family metallopeptidase [Gemmatimonadota bacterium]